MRGLRGHGVRAYARCCVTIDPADPSVTIILRPPTKTTTHRLYRTQTQPPTQKYLQPKPRNIRDSDDLANLGTAEVEVDGVAVFLSQQRRLQESFCVAGAELKADASDEIDNANIEDM